MNLLEWLLPEPPGAQAALRRLAGENPSAARAEIVKCLSERLWPSLERVDCAGATPALLAAVLSDLAYESWLWVMGDRTWEHFAEALAGRLWRRSEVYGQERATAGS